MTVVGQDHLHTEGKSVLGTKTLLCLIDTTEQPMAR